MPLTNITGERARKRTCLYKIVIAWYNEMTSLDRMTNHVVPTTLTSCIIFIVSPCCLWVMHIIILIQELNTLLCLLLCLLLSPAAPYRSQQYGGRPEYFAIKAGGSDFARLS